MRIRWTPAASADLQQISATTATEEHAREMLVPLLLYVGVIV